MQNWCVLNREGLLKQGTDYPAVEIRDDIWPITNDRTPKHGFLVGALRSGNMDNVSAAIASAEAPTLLLSTEGLSNHFYSFPAENLAKIRDMFGEIPVELFLVYRDKSKWLKSLWNEGVISFPGTIAPFEEHIEFPIVKRLANWERLKIDLVQGFGASHVEEVVLEENGWRIPLLNYLNATGIRESENTEGQLNVSVGPDMIEFVRHVNMQRLETNIRLMLFSLMQQLFNTSNVTLRNAESWSTPTPAQLKKIEQGILRTGTLPEAAEKIRATILAEIANLK